MNSTFRNDIAGLRGLAIIFVVLNHLTSRNFQNGYAGVDIFFVLSGYLIIGGMIKAYENSIIRDKNKAFFSVEAFYLRRFLRLAPAALVVTLTTLVLTVVFFNSVRATKIIEDAIWSSVLLANYHFLQNGVDYFSRGSIPSPFQHFWSLSIEEQFYVFFPLIFVFVIGLHGFKVFKLSIGWRGRINLLLVFGFLFSFIYALTLFNQSQTSYYFSTPARAWQLLLGGLLYVFQNRIIFHQNRKSKAISLLLLVALFAWIIMGGGGKEVSFSVIVTSSMFAALCILLFSDESYPGRFFLNNKFFIFMGSISYSLYLWHWPIRIFTLHLIDNAIIVDLVFVVLSVAVATLSRRYIEIPFMKIKPKSNLKFSEVDLIKSLPRLNLWEFKVKAWIALLAIFSMPGLALFNSSYMPSQTLLLNASEFSDGLGELAMVTQGDIESGTSTKSSPMNDYNEVLLEWNKNIKVGLGIKSIPPTLEPSFSKILDERGSHWNNCLFMYKNTECIYGQKNSQRKIVVFGDSFAVSLIPAITEAFSSSGAQIIGLTLHECGVSSVTPWLLGEPFTDCKVNRDWAIQRINSIEPELVIMAENATIPIAKSRSKASEKERADLWAIGLKDTFKILSELRINSKMLYVGQWPVRDLGITDCVNADMAIADSCIGRAQNGANLRSTASQLAQNSSINYVDSSRWMCDAYLCPAIISNSPVTFDNGHLANTFSKKLGPLLKSYLESIGIAFTK